MTYLCKERDRAVDLTRGAMGSLLDRLGKLITKDYTLEASVKTDIESFLDDLANIHLRLRKLENVDGAKILVNQVREFSYKIENVLDSFLVHVKLNSNGSGFRELTHEGLKLLVNSTPTQHQINDVIRDIKNQVQVVAHMINKYNLDVNKVLVNTTTKACIDPWITGIYIDRKQLIGIEAPRDMVIGLLHEDGSASNENLKIVSITGMGGLGKATLARAVYDEMKTHHTKAFVPVGQNTDLETVLKKIIRKFIEKCNTKNMDVDELIEKLQELPLFPC